MKSRVIIFCILQFSYNFVTSISIDEESSRQKRNQTFIRQGHQNNAGHYYNSELAHSQNVKTVKIQEYDINKGIEQYENTDFVKPPSPIQSLPMRERRQNYAPETNEHRLDNRQSLPIRMNMPPILKQNEQERQHNGEFDKPPKNIFRSLYTVLGQNSSFSNVQQQYFDQGKHINRNIRPAIHQRYRAERNPTFERKTNFNPTTDDDDKYVQILPRPIRNEPVKHSPAILDNKLKSTRLLLPQPTSYDATHVAPSVVRSGLKPVDQSHQVPVEISITGNNIKRVRYLENEPRNLAGQFNQRNVRRPVLNSRPNIAVHTINDDVLEASETLLDAMVHKRHIDKPVIKLETIIESPESSESLALIKSSIPNNEEKYLNHRQKANNRFVENFAPTEITTVNNKKDAETYSVPHLGHSNISPVNKPNPYRHIYQHYLTGSNNGNVKRIFNKSENKNEALSFTVIQPNGTVQHIDPVEENITQKPAVLTSVYNKESLIIDDDKTLPLSLVLTPADELSIQDFLDSLSKKTIYHNKHLSNNEYYNQEAQTLSYSEFISPAGPQISNNNNNYNLSPLSQTFGNDYISPSKLHRRHEIKYNPYNPTSENDKAKVPSKLHTPILPSGVIKKTAMPPDDIVSKFPSKLHTHILPGGVIKKTATPPDDIVSKSPSKLHTHIITSGIFEKTLTPLNDAASKSPFKLHTHIIPSGVHEKIALPPDNVESKSPSKLNRHILPSDVERGLTNDKEYKQDLIKSLDNLPALHNTANDDELTQVFTDSRSNDTNDNSSQISSFVSNETDQHTLELQNNSNENDQAITSLATKTDASSTSSTTNTPLDTCDEKTSIYHEELVPDNVKDGSPTKANFLSLTQNEQNTNNKNNLPAKYNFPDDNQKGNKVKAVIENTHNMVKDSDYVVKGSDDVDEILVDFVVESSIRNRNSGVKISEDTKTEKYSKTDDSQKYNKARAVIETTHNVAKDSDDVVKDSDDVVKDSDEVDEIVVEFVVENNTKNGDDKVNISKGTKTTNAGKIEDNCSDDSQKCSETRAVIEKSHDVAKDCDDMVKDSDDVGIGSDNVDEIIVEFVDDSQKYNKARAVIETTHDLAMDSDDVVKDSDDVVKDSNEVDEIVVEVVVENNTKNGDDEVNISKDTKTTKVCKIDDSGKCNKARAVIETTHDVAKDSDHVIKDSDDVVKDSDEVDEIVVEYVVENNTKNGDDEVNISKDTKTTKACKIDDSQKCNKARAVIETTHDVAKDSDHVVKDSDDVVKDSDEVDEIVVENNAKNGDDEVNISKDNKTTEARKIETEETETHDVVEHNESNITDVETLNEKTINSGDSGEQKNGEDPNLNKKLLFDFSNTAIVWNKTDSNLFEQLNTKNASTFNIFYVIQMQPQNQPIVEKTNETITYSNGTCIEEIRETTWLYADDPSPTITTTKRIYECDES